MSFSLGFLAGRTLGTRNKWPELECLGNGCGGPSQTACLQEREGGKEDTFVSARLLQDIPAAAKPGSEPGGVLHPRQEIHTELAFHRDLGRVIVQGFPDFLLLG